jgi:phosphohistidine phosphatase
MKTLYVVRHAKASLKDPDISDLERPLLEKGKKRTKRIIDFLTLHRVKPDIILTSPARRAMETAQYLAKGLSCSENIIKKLTYFYSIDERALLNEFLDFPDKYKKVMIVGHNPAITNFVNFFSKKKLDSLPTSSVACLKFKMEKWEEIESAKCTVEFVVYPSMLKYS